EIDKEVFGTEHIDYAADCNNLAYFYNNLGKYEKAEPLFIKAKNIDGKVLGKNHTAYARDCNNLAVLYDATGRYSKAEDLFIEAKNINKKALGENHKEYALDCSNLAALYEDIGNFNKAENLLLQSISIIDKNVKLNFTFLSEKEKEMYFATINHYYELFNSFALKRKNENPGITAYVYNNTVNNKGLLLKSSTAMRNVILSSNDEELISNYKNWIELKKQIIKLNSSGKETKDLEEQANKVEKELVKGSQYFANDKKTQNNNWKDVQKMLKADEAAIEFVHFKYYNKYWTDSTLYCAIIVKPKSKYPEMIPLFEEKQLLALTDKYGSGSFSYIRNLYGPGNEKNSELYNIIWEPLEKYLENIKTVYISPSGLLHKISFSALCQGQNVYLCDNYNINSQSSTGKIIMPENQKLASNITANIFGGVEYSNDKTETEIWSFLDGTLTETQIINFFLEDKKIKTNYYTESDASEENFKKTSPFCDVLHLATHGFFYPSIEEIEKDTTNNNLSRGGRSGFGVYQFVKNKNPLMRSGLVLAGANNVWQEYTPTIIEDGVLTAEEVASVDLRKAQVVVLSACETGLGDIRGTEGVYGLQRAFKMAGAKFIIMSLWEVPDKETEEFMTTFYSKLLATKDIKLAFIQTQNEMRAKYDPYYWAAFVLIE
ncbi:MAG: CHAT domain-containing protein, partial [Bacteroidetes bacterium]|nr:CHAT domain-containing protein [Bacteroidota bacterium]